MPENPEHDHITHAGEKMKPKHYAKDSQRHMGTMEDNVHPLPPLVIGPVKATAAEEDETHDEHHTHRELTPG